MIALLWRNWPTHKVNENISFYFFIPSHTTLQKLPIPLPGLWCYNIFYHFYIYKANATSEYNLSLQTKGVLILVPGIFGVLSNISLMLIILSIASAQRYCLRNVKSSEQKPLYLRKETMSVFPALIQFQDHDKAFYLLYVDKFTFSRRIRTMKSHFFMDYFFWKLFSHSDDSPVNIPACCIISRAVSMEPQRKTVILPGIKSTLDQYSLNAINGTSRNRSWEISCRDDPESEATILMSLAVLGIVANSLLMILIIVRGRFSR